MYGFEGLRIVVKHDPKLQTELIGLLAGVDQGQLGIWIVKGWGEALTGANAKEQLRTLMIAWANQDDIRS